MNNQYNWSSFALSERHSTNDYMKYRNSREGSTILTIQSIVFTFKKFMMKISVAFASTTQGEYEN